MPVLFDIILSILGCFTLITLGMSIEAFRNIKSTSKLVDKMNRKWFDENADKIIAEWVARIFVHGIKRDKDDR